MVKTGQTWSGVFVALDATGALSTPSVGPAGVLYVDGTANGAAVTVSGANPYKWTVTLPALTAGQCVSMYITATIAAIATASVVAEDVADTAYGSEALRPTVAGRTLDVSAGGEAGIDWANVGSPTTTVGLSGTTIKASTDTETDIAALPTAVEIVAAIDADPPAVNVTLQAGVLIPGPLALEATAQAILEDTGTTLPGLIAAGGSGAGAVTFTYTLTSTVDSAPIADADVWVTSDEAGSVVLASGRTDQNGVVTFYLDAGTVYVWRQKSGWNFENPDTEVVA